MQHCLSYLVSNLVSVRIHRTKANKREKILMRSFHFRCQRALLFYPWFRTDCRAGHVWFIQRRPSTRLDSWSAGENLIYPVYSHTNSCMQDEQTFRVVVEQCGSYNSLVECVVKGDTLSSGAIVEDTNGNHTINNGGQKKWTPEEESQIRDGRETARKHEQDVYISHSVCCHQTTTTTGLIAADFLQDTATQLTYYGLELLMEIIPADQPCVLFRNNHVSYNAKGQDMFTGKHLSEWQSFF